MKKIVLLLCLFLVFVACGKDKTIEKIIYGNDTRYGENPTVLDKADFDKIPISKSFNSYDDFCNYMAECFESKANILGKKFKITNTFNVVEEDCRILDEKHFWQYCIRKYGDEPLDFTIHFANANNISTSQISEVTFLVTICIYRYGQTIIAQIKGYSYDL